VVYYSTFLIIIFHLVAIGAWRENDVMFNNVLAFVLNC